LACPVPKSQFLENEKIKKKIKTTREKEKKSQLTGYHHSPSTTEIQFF